MLTKFKAERSRSARITKVEISRETEKSVFIGGQRQKKMGEFVRYHDSWDEAHAYLVAYAEAQVIRARRALELANSTLGNVKGMRKPADAEQAGQPTT